MIQYYVIKHKLLNIKTFNIVLRQEKGEGFNILDVKEKLDAQLTDSKKEFEMGIEHFKNVLKQKTMPAISAGEHCTNPYKCDFFEYCTKQSNIQNER
jgi:hypothetical protein